MPLIQPALNATPFAKNGLRNTIPTNADPDAEAAASMELGFPELTMKKITLGGIPPSGRDMNGILNFLSQHQVWLNGGGQYKFNVEMANAVGGYAKGAVIASNDGMRLYVCKYDGNLHDPNTDLTGWALFSTDQLENTLNSLQDQITIEKADRIYSDNLLNDKIDQEIRTRQDQVVSLQQAISDEAATRSNADYNLQQNIDGEANTRTIADNNERDARIAGDINERDARIAGDNALSDRVWTLEHAPIQPAIGVGQSVIDMMSIRTTNTTYYNTTGRPIEVSIVAQAHHNGGNQSVNLYVNGLVRASVQCDVGPNGWTVATLSSIVPDGSNYGTNSGSIFSWTELR